MQLLSPTLRGRRVRLEPFGPELISERYLGWLNDPEVNRYSRRALMDPITEEDARAYLASLAPGEQVLAIHASGWGHVGNVKFGPVDLANSRCDVSILVGERAVWGWGIGAEAVYLVCRHLFEERGLNRVDAGSANPAFLRLVEKLGWRIEGVQRERVRDGSGAFLDFTLVAQLAADFRRLPQYEPEAAA